MLSDTDTDAHSEIHHRAVEAFLKSANRATAQSRFNYEIKKWQNKIRAST